MSNIYVSDCCGVPSNEDHEVCSRCGEHCEIITDESGRDWLVTNDAWLDMAVSFPGETDFDE